MKTLWERGEIFEILTNVNFWYQDKVFWIWGTAFSNQESILLNFWDNYLKHKENFLWIFNDNKSPDSNSFEIDFPDWFKKVMSLDLYSDNKVPWFMKRYNLNLKKWDYISDKNSFNLLHIIYKKAKSFNKYWIRKYLFNEYIQRDEIPSDKLDLFKRIALDFYSNECDITDYIVWTENFIYRDYSDEEIDVLYEMWLVIKDYDDELNIFKDLYWFTINDILYLKVKDKNKSRKRLKKNNIFSDKLIHECFIYFYENTDSFSKYWIREEQLLDFIWKKKIWVKSAMKYIKVLVNYINSLDEIYSTPFCKILDKIWAFNDVYYNLIEFENTEMLVNYLEWFYNKEELNLDNIVNEYIDNNHELMFLSIFYNIDNIVWYRYHDDFTFYDSEYLKDDWKNTRKWIWISHDDYNNLLN